jgi:hypothetical protein
LTGLNGTKIYILSNITILNAIPLKFECIFWFEGLFLAVYHFGFSESGREDLSIGGNLAS